MISDCIRTGSETNKNREDWNYKKVEEYEYQGKLDIYLFWEETYGDM